MKKIKKIVGSIFIAAAALYLLLLIPDAAPKPVQLSATQQPFIWNKDSLWLALEMQMARAKAEDSSLKITTIAAMDTALLQQLRLLQQKNIPYTDSLYHHIENHFFKLAPLVAGMPQYVPDYVTHYNGLRAIIKKQSAQWPLDKPEAFNQLYRLLYGMRAAVEEVLLQADSNKAAQTHWVTAEPSATPAAIINGITVHSGDILVSRGGAVVSAFIARGNNHPGNFSHIALVYVDEHNGKPYLLESHIEKGVAIADVSQYLKDKKLRFMVMRLRSDLPALKRNPMLPHVAATAMYQQSLKNPIPYDFAMNYRQPDAMFCSEVAYHAYRQNGITLWPQLSVIADTGVANWLHQFGVENFSTQMPADLEYDAQLNVVAEWRDNETLYKDHVDNAVMDAMLERANRGWNIRYNHWMLPIARIIKTWSVIKNKMGSTGPIPQGMNATTALKNQWLVQQHNKAVLEVKAMADGFIKTNNYRPPYWQLLDMARREVNKL